jgi:hypothetical protein
LKDIGKSIFGYFGVNMDDFKFNQQEGGQYNVTYKQWLIVDVPRICLIHIPEHLLKLTYKNI